MICDKCHGAGYCETPHRSHVPEVVAFERGYTEPIKCSRCNGTGFLSGNIHEIIETLNRAIGDNRPLTIRELKHLKLKLMQ